MRNDERILVVLNSEVGDEIRGFDRSLYEGLDKGLEHTKREGA